MYYRNDYSRDRIEGLNISLTSDVLSCRYSRLAERRMRDDGFVSSGNDVMHDDIGRFRKSKFSLEKNAGYHTIDIYLR